MENEGGGYHGHILRNYKGGPPTTATTTRRRLGGYLRGIIGCIHHRLSTFVHVIHIIIIIIIHQRHVEGSWLIGKSWFTGANGRVGLVLVWGGFRNEASEKAVSQMFRNKV